MGIETISPAKAVSYIGKRNVLFIDIREKEEYRAGHIPGAVCMEYEEVIRRKLELSKYQIVIIYCERGNSSLMLARELMELPIQVKSIAYGISGYQGPLYRDRS